MISIDPFSFWLGCAAACLAYAFAIVVVVTIRRR